MPAAALLRPLHAPLQLLHLHQPNAQQVRVPPHLLQEPAQPRHPLNERQALVALHLLQEPAEPEQQQLHSEQQALLPQRYNALHAQQVRLYNSPQYARPDTQAAHHLQALAPAVKCVPAQRAPEHALALLGSVLYSDHKNGALPW